MTLIFHCEIDVLISVNKMYGEKYDWKTRRRVRFLLPEARRWKTRAKNEFMVQHTQFPKYTPSKYDVYSYSYEFSFPDGHTRDGENYLKIITDALQDANIIYNDSQVRKGIWMAKIDRGVPYKKVTIDVYKE